MRGIVLITMLAICFSSCTKETQHNKIHKIVFASGGCYGTCPVEVIEIDSSLTYRYHGERHTNLQGFYTGKITQELWDSINNKLEAANFRNLDTLYDESIDDLATSTKIYYDNNKVKFIRAQERSLPKKTADAYSFISETTHRVKLTPATTTDGFDLTILFTTVKPLTPIQAPKE